MNSFSVRTKIMMGGGLETIAPKLHKVFIVTDDFMASAWYIPAFDAIMDAEGEVTISKKGEAKCQSIL